MRLTPFLLGLACSALLPASAQAELTITRVFNINQLVPDGGQYVDAQTLDLGGGIVTRVNIGLSLVASADQPAWAGDYYAAVTHDTGYAVLLNRIGKTDTDLFGSNANGLDITFSDAAANDIHLAPYDTAATVTTPLTGYWQPDAREADPANVSDTTPRTAYLSSFEGTSTDGQWILLVADDSAGGVARLASWSLAVTFNGSLPAGLTSSDTVTNPGTLILETPQTLNAHLVNQGTVVGPTSPDEVLTFTGNITGAGNFQGNFVFTGTYSPGNSPAVITFDGNALFSPEHILTMELGGTEPGSGYDTLHVTGVLTFGGTLTILLIDDFDPVAGSDFQLFTADAFEGSFSNIDLPSGYQWITDRLASEGILSIAAVPEPAVFAALAGLFALAAALRRKRIR